MGDGQSFSIAGGGGTVTHGGFLVKDSCTAQIDEQTKSGWTAYPSVEQHVVVSIGDPNALGQHLLRPW